MSLRSPVWKFASPRWGEAASAARGVRGCRVHNSGPIPLTLAHFVRLTSSRQGEVKIVQLVSHLRARGFVQTQAVMRIMMRCAGETVGVARSFRRDPVSRGKAVVVRNAPPAAAETKTLIAAAAPRAAAQPVPAVAPEAEQVAIFPRHDRAGRIMPCLPGFRRQLLLPFAHDDMCLLSAGAFFVPSPLVGEGGALRAKASNKPGEGERSSRSLCSRPLTRPRTARAALSRKGRGKRKCGPAMRWHPGFAARHAQESSAHDFSFRPKIGHEKRGTWSAGRRIQPCPRQADIFRQPTPRRAS